MKKLLLLCITLTGVVTLMNCSPKTTGVVATQKPKEATEVKSSYTQAEIDEGKRTWGMNCEKCHKLYEPTSHSRADWEKILPRMGKKAKLDDKQLELVKAYIYKAMEG